MTHDWPKNKRFAFTILDDADCGTLQNGPIVYDFLNELGFKTSKSVWIFDGEVRDDNLHDIGTTCQDEKYLDWVLKLKKQGFEIAWHSSSWSRSPRERVIEALDAFKSYFGQDPRVLAQHNDTIPNESIYWGVNRLSGFNRKIYGALMRLRGEKRDIYLGDSKGSPYFWGDICRQRIRYVRNFIYPDMNTLKECSFQPYHDPDRPYVHYWFTSTEGKEANSFCERLSVENQQRLEEEGGACILYTHFGRNFVADGKLNSDFKRLMERLARRDGWFVPVSELLDHLLEKNGEHILSNAERAGLERKWLWYKLKAGTA